MDFIEWMTTYNWLSVLVRVLLAGLFGGLIGSERGRHGRAAGLRTHILVCVGSAMTALTGLFAANELGHTGDIFRIAAQVVSGIGFLGVGMILVRNRTVVTGLTTAAGMWATATIGIAVGYGFYIGAFVATLLCVVAVPLLGHFEEKSKTITNLYLEIEDTAKTGALIRRIRSILQPLSVDVNVTSPKSTAPHRVGVLLLVKSFSIPEEKLAALEALEGVAFVVEECNA